MTNIIIALAHSLAPDEAEALGLPAKTLRPGTEVVVPEDVARGLIGAGYAAVETEKPREVAHALRRRAPEDHEVGVYQPPEENPPSDEKAPTQTLDASVATSPSEGVPPSATRGGSKR
jgi:hypothetical protein